MVRSCPKCKTNEYTNRNLIMMINECGHPLCQNCVENIFARNSNRCPYEGCVKVLRKNGFREQIFDDSTIERENHIRKRLNKIYNLHEDDFGTLREYNDYLEHFEDIVYKLVNEIDVEEIETEISDFQEKNSEIIKRNVKRLSKDDIWINQMIDEETNRTRRLKVDSNDNGKSKTNLQVNPKAIINELRESDLPAEVVLDRQRKIQIEAEMAEKEESIRKKLDKQERQRRLYSDSVSYAPIRTSGNPYHHIPPILQINGPRLPLLDEIQSRGYLDHVVQSNLSALAGGYVSEIGCCRAIFESYQDLLIV